MRETYLSGGALTHYKWLKGKGYSIVIPTRWRGALVPRCSYYNIGDSPIWGTQNMWKYLAFVP